MRKDALLRESRPALWVSARHYGRCGGSGADAHIAVSRVYNVSHFRSHRSILSQLVIFILSPSPSYSSLFFASSPSRPIHQSYFSPSFQIAEVSTIELRSMTKDLTFDLILQGGWCCSGGTAVVDGVVLGMQLGWGGMESWCLIADMRETSLRNKSGWGGRTL